MATVISDPDSQSTATGDPGSPNRPEKRSASSTLTPEILRQAAIDAFRKLDPRTLWRNTVMFVVEVGAVLTTILFIGSLTGANREIVLVGDVADSPVGTAYPPDCSPLSSTYWCKLLIASIARIHITGPEDSPGRSA